MDKVRVLKWIDDDWNFSVETRIGILSCVRDDEGDKDWHAKWIFYDTDDSIGYYHDADTAMDACESDYIARCSEFLRVAGPGEVVISIETANSCMAALDDPQRKKTNPGDPTAYGNLTAAIDAAGGGKNGF